jgi:hypothetical protein
MLHMLQDKIFQVSQVFQTYVANVLSGCFRSRSWRCICCNAYTRMFQVFHLFKSYVVNVLSGCFTSRSGVLHMLQWRRWPADSDLPYGFGSYLVPSLHIAPRPLLCSSLPSFPSLSSITPWQFELGRKTLLDERVDVG